MGIVESIGRLLEGEAVAAKRAYAELVRAEAAGNETDPAKAKRILERASKTVQDLMGDVGIIREIRGLEADLAKMRPYTALLAAEDEALAAFTQQAILERYQAERELANKALRAKQAVGDRTRLDEKIAALKSEHPELFQ